MVRGALSDDHMIQLKVVTGTLTLKSTRTKSRKLVLGHPWTHMVARDDI